LTAVLFSVAAVAVTVFVRSFVTLRSSGPVKRSQLALAIDGGAMEEYLESPAQKDLLLEWIEDGAPQDEWDAVEPILDESCILCHDGETEPDIVPLNQYSLASRVSKVRSLLAEKAEWGTMTRYFEEPGEKEAVMRWIEANTPESDWPEIEPIMMERCVSCHNPETGVQGLVSLDRYPSTARSAKPPPPLPPTGAVMAASIGSLLIALVGVCLTWRKKRSD
jgi:hypothetical protein